MSVTKIDNLPDEIRKILRDPLVEIKRPKYRDMSLLQPLTGDKDYDDYHYKIFIDSGEKDKHS